MLFVVSIDEPNELRQILRNSLLVDGDTWSSSFLLQTFFVVKT